MDHGSIIMLSAVAKSWLFECRSAGNVPRESIPGECGLSQGSSKYRWLSGAESDESDVRPGCPLIYISVELHRSSEICAKQINRGEKDINDHKRGNKNREKRRNYREISG